MRAVAYDRYGSLDVLTARDLPDPKVGPSELLVEVRTAGVNPVDWKLMSGALDPMMEATFPIVPGWDVAGVVRATGPDTPEFEVGDEVLAYARKDWVHRGTFAELVTVPVRAAARKPADLSWAAAGALPLTGLTALRTLRALRVGEGDTVLIHGAAGGVGRIAVQLARLLGATVIATASAANHDRLRALGATPVTYGDGLVGRVRDLAPDGVSAVADFVGGVLDDTLAVLGEGGRHASVTDPFLEQHGGHWIWVRPDGTELQWLADLAGRGDIVVDIADTYALDQVASAFERSQEGHVAGKLVIVVSEDD